MKNIVLLIIILFTGELYAQDFWQQPSKSYAGKNINSIVINSSGHIFAASGISGIYRSTDNGINWVQVNNGLTDMLLQRYSHLNLLQDFVYLYLHRDIPIYR